MSDYLFTGDFINEAFRAQDEKLARAAEAIPSDRALGRSVDELAAELVEKFHVQPLVVDWGAMTATIGDAKVDVSGDWNRGPFLQSGPVNVVGTKVTYHIAFRGDEDLFKFRPSTHLMNPPQGVVKEGEVRVSLTVPAPVPDNVGAELDRQVAAIRTHLDWINNDVEAFNRRLVGTARQAAQRRRDKVLADHELAARLGVPLRRREDAAPTYATPAVRYTAVLPAPAGAQAQPPEPVVLPEEYERILGIVRGMALVLERSPKAFAGMREEDIRQQFLVQLNGQYQGGATGETFNAEGKTDILVRDGNRNVFIAECKFWGGPKLLSETVNQVLRYTSWRDTKAAIFLFNRNKDLSRVLEQISPALAAHPSFVREIPYGAETEFRFVLCQPNDRARELALTILVFEVPV